MIGRDEYQSNHPSFSPVSFTLLVGFSLMIPNSEILRQIARDRLASLFLGRLLEAIDGITWMERHRMVAHACAQEMADHYVTEIVRRNELASDEIKTYTTMIESALTMAGTRFAAQLSDDPNFYKKEWRKIFIQNADEDTPTLLAWCNAPLQTLSKLPRPVAA
jgi:hypothetical protein